VLTVSGLIINKFVAFASNVETIYAAVMERMFYHVIDGKPTKPLVPSDEYVFSQLKSIWISAKHKLPFVPSVNLKDFPLLYTGRKKGIYERAVKQITEGLLRWRVVSNSWSKIRGFLKFEKLEVKPGKRLVPRLILARDPKYHALLGRYIRPMEHPIYLTLQKCFGKPEPVIAKGLNGNQLGEVIRAKWERLSMAGTPAALGLDMSRFDQHISAPILRFEHRFYTTCNHDKDLARLLALQVVNNGSIVGDDGLVTFKHVSMRGSGDMNTGLGNCIIMASIIHSFITHHNLNVDEIDVIINGDDSVIFCDAKHIDRLTSSFSSYVEPLGFVAKVENPVFVLEHVSFCQMRPINRGDQYVMVREWPTVLSKDITTCHSCMTKSYYLAYLRAIGEAGLALCAGIPVMQEWYKFLLSGAEKACRRELLSDTGVAIWAANLISHESPVSDVARVSFFKAFGVTPECQKNIEDAYSSMNLQELKWDVHSPAHYFGSQYNPRTWC
jgi:hypothetical protein